MDYEGNFYREPGDFYRAVCVNEIHTAYEHVDFIVECEHNRAMAVLCIGANYRDRGCNYNGYVREHNTTDDLPPTTTIADCEWTGALSRFMLP